jgi:hypothetical protein
MVDDVVFDVVGRSKTDRITKEGNRETVFKVQLKSTNGKMKLSISGSDPSLIQQYPLDSAVPVNIGVCNQKTLSDLPLGKDLEEAAEALDEEARS